MFRSAFLLLSGNAFSSFLTLVRNLAVARLVSVEDYGIAVTFAISMAIVEMTSGLGLPQLIVQDKKGDDPHMQAGLQALNLARSMLSAVVLFAIAGPIARFLGIPHVTWAYQLLALATALRGLAHFDIYRLNRQMQYRPLILSNVVPAVASLLSIWPLFYIFGDYRVMLYAVMIQTIGMIAASHFVATRPYRMVWDRAIAMLSLRFGWPILIGNVMLFAVFEGDKLIVGHEIGIETLAIFAMGTTLTLAPALVMESSLQQFLLPQLSAVADHRDRYTRLAMTAMQASLMIGLFLIVVIVLIGAPLVQVVLGEKYETLIPLLIWLSILQAVRVFKAGATVASLAKAQTANGVIAVSVRLLTIPFIWHVAASGGDLREIIWVATVGELGGFVVSLLLVRYRLGLGLRQMRVPVIAAFAMIAASVAHAFLSERFASSDTQIWSALGVLLLFPVSFMAMRELRAHIRTRNLIKGAD